ncbi:MAG: class I SAM-dependent methyltransferase [Acidimicrobiia bacterium]|nr:class I SAM-dependent methyltransferase [Acidimicrobiia bacterium]
MDVNQWPDVEHALAYLAIADAVPHRTEGEEVLLEVLPDAPSRVLDLGTGDGRLLALVRTAHPEVEGVALDFSPPMIERFRERFADVDDVTLVEHDLDNPLPALGSFDAVVSSFAIHHTVDARKREIFAEVRSLLRPGGVFANLEHVASATPWLHEQFRVALGEGRDDRDDPSNKLAPVEDQLEWLRQVGFIDVDCLWKWRELALLVGWRPN